MRLKESQRISSAISSTNESEAAESIKALWEAENMYDLTRMLNEAEKINHENIIQFGAIRDKVLQNLWNHVASAGTPFGTSLNGLNKILKGHRTGELTIVTGRTGQGKTTVVSQISLELAQQGVHTLWGSFEIKNDTLVTKMMQQHAKISLKGCTEAVFNEHADSFEKLPMWFMTFYGRYGVTRHIWHHVHEIRLGLPHRLSHILVIGGWHVGSFQLLKLSYQTPSRSHDRIDDG